MYPRVVKAVMWKQKGAVICIVATCNPWRAHPIMSKDKETQDIEVQKYITCSSLSDWLWG